MIIGAQKAKKTSALVDDTPFIFDEEASEECGLEDLIFLDPVEFGGLPPNDFSTALRDAVKFKESLEGKVYQADDSMAVKYWKFVYSSVRWVLVLAFYGGILCCLVLCLGVKGSSIFFGVTLLLFLVFHFFFGRDDDLTLI